VGEKEFKAVTIPDSFGNGIFFIGGGRKKKAGGRDIEKE